jgi:hypothetical protein
MITSRGHPGTDARFPSAVGFPSVALLHFYAQIPRAVQARRRIFEVILYFSGYGVISNEAGGCKSFFLRFFVGIEHTSSSAHELRLFAELLFICVHPQWLSLLRSSTWCCPPVISSITNDHDEFFDLPFREAGSLITQPVTFAP